MLIITYVLTSEFGKTYLDMVLLHSHTLPLSKQTEYRYIRCNLNGHYNMIKKKKNEHLKMFTATILH